MLGLFSEPGSTEEKEWVFRVHMVTLASRLEFLRGKWGTRDEVLVVIRVLGRMKG